MKAKSFWHSNGLADDKKECALAHSRAERGRLRHISSSRECASCGAFLCHRTKFPMTPEKGLPWLKGQPFFDPCDPLVKTGGEQAQNHNGHNQ